jgi:hypothetical protein
VVRLVSFSRLIGTLLIGVLASVAPVAAADDSVALPFGEGAAVRIVQGYNGGTHQGASMYGLDLVVADGETSGAAILAPFDGRVAWAFAPGDKTGCIEVVAADGRFGAMLCHVLLDRPFGRGERVVRGQQLGAVGEPGTVGNNGLAHVHMELHAGGRSSNPVPFSVSDGGLSLEGWDLPDTGVANDHESEGPIVSTNFLAAPALAEVPVIEVRRQERSRGTDRPAP